jgi:hypothetical protein
MVYFVLKGMISSSIDRDGLMFNLLSPYGEVIKTMEEA